MIVAGRYCWGPSEAECKREIHELAENACVADSINWRGTYTQEEAPSLMQSADILLHPKYNDPCPRLVVEAMACGLPIVYSHSGGMPELVGHEAGVGVPAPCDWDQDHPPQPLELADALNQVILHYAAMSAAARERAVTSLDVKTWQHQHTLMFKKLSTHPSP
jgi:glycosyltransferase involved in cell wall biosynthesis